MLRLQGAVQLHKGFLQGAALLIPAHSSGLEKLLHKGTKLVARFGDPPYISLCRTVSAYYSSASRCMGCSTAESSMAELVKVEAQPVPSMVSTHSMAIHSHDSVR